MTRVTTVTATTVTPTTVTKWEMPSWLSLWLPLSHAWVPDGRDLRLDLEFELTKSFPRIFVSGMQWAETLVFMWSYLLPDNGRGYSEGFHRLTSLLEDSGSGGGPGGFPETSWLTFSFFVLVCWFQGASYLEIGSLGNQGGDELERVVFGGWGG